MWFYRILYFIFPALLVAFLLIPVAHEQGIGRAIGWFIGVALVFLMGGYCFGMYDRGVAKEREWQKKYG